MTDMTALQAMDVTEYFIPVESSEGLITEGLISNICLSFSSYYLH